MNLCFLRLQILRIGLLSAFLFPATLFPQGSLTPPGAPLPTMKTLSEVEPRIAINATNTPGDATNVFKITQPGSYYLTGNVVGVSGKHGIQISASGVTIDLNGFELLGTTVGFFSGVNFPVSGLTNIAIINGSIRNWGGYGISNAVNLNNVRVTSLLVTGNQAGGISLDNVCSIVRDCVVSNTAGGRAITVGQGSTVANCSLHSNSGGFSILALDGSTVSNCSVTLGGSVGIEVGFYCNVTNCSVSYSVGSGSTGIEASFGSTLSNCSACGNASTGIVTSSGCSLVNCTANDNATGGINTGNSTLTNCTANTNTGTGISASNSTLTNCTALSNFVNGINAGSDSVLVACTSNGNTAVGINAANGCSLQGCNVNNNGANGITVGLGCTVRGCHVRSNPLNGIQSDTGGQIIDNLLDSNGLAAGTQSNILITGNACRVEGNSITGGDRGIATNTGGNLIIRNSVRGGTNAYGGIAALNDVGPIGSAATATSPWANISY